MLIFFLLLSISIKASTFKWLRSFGGSQYENSFSTVVDKTGSVYTSGRFRGTAGFDPVTNTYNLTSNGDYDFVIQKLDPSGNFLWARSIGKDYNDVSYSIDVDSLGNVYAVGKFKDTVDFYPGAGVFNLTAVSFYDIFVLKLNS